MFASLALHIVMMNEYELEIDKSIPINQMRMALARSMLGELYWRIGVFIDNNEMICCARIHFELAIENNVCDFSIHTISIRDMVISTYVSLCTLSGVNRKNSSPRL